MIVGCTIGLQSADFSPGCSTQFIQLHCPYSFSSHCPFCSCWWRVQVVFVQCPCFPGLGVWCSDVHIMSAQKIKTVELDGKIIKLQIVSGGCCEFADTTSVCTVSVSKHKLCPLPSLPLPSLAVGHGRSGEVRDHCIQLLSRSKWNHNCVRCHRTG